MAKNKDKAAPAAEATGTTPAETPAAAPATTGAAAPATSGTVHTKAELEAAITAGRARGPLADDGSVANSPSMQRLLKDNPGDKDMFLRDANGALCVFDLTSEKGKKALLRKSAGPTGGWFVVRTSDVHQQRFLRSEKPKGGKRSAKSLPAATGVDLAKV